MGHIVSSLAFRLGNTTVWPDHWFIKNIYYSYFLHTVFKIKFYCMFFFFAKHYDSKAIFFSHFSILKYFKKIHVDIFYYDGKWEDEFEDYKWELYIKYYYLDINRDPETRISYRRFAVLMVLNIIFLIIGQKLRKSLEYQLLEKKIIVYTLRYNKYIHFNEYFKKKYGKMKFMIYQKKVFYFIFFIHLFISIRKIIRRSSIFIYPNYYYTIRRYYYYGVINKYTKRWARAMSYVYSYYYQEAISSLYKVNMHFYLTDNNCVNARFLSRYIARKLKQGSYMKQLLNPIKKELLFLMRLSLIPWTFYRKNCLKNYYFSKSYYITKKGYYNSFINYIYYIYKIIINYYFIKNNMYLNMDFIIKTIYINNQINFLNTYDYIKKKEYMKKIHNYLYSNIIYITIYEYKFLINSLVKIFMPKSNYSIKNYSNNKFYGLLNFVYKALYMNKLSLVLKIIYEPLNKLYEDRIIDIWRSLGINHRRYIKYIYNKYSYDLFFRRNNINYLRSRINYVTRGNNLIGYKMKLSGRFTRKQRAGHYWFSRGKAPLNTLSALVDYAIFFLPLKNSTISVRVWLYKSVDVEDSYYVKLY